MTTALRLESLREQVLEYSLKMSHEGLAPSTWGNVSALDPESGLMAITPSAIPYDQLTPADICLISLDGEHVECPHKPSTETPLHLVFYKGRPGTLAVVHTHSLYATAFAVAGQEIPCCITTQGSTVGGRVPCAPYTKSGTEEFGQIALDAMGDRQAVLLGNHGVVTIGSSLDEAYTAAIIVEAAAKIVSFSSAIGTPNELPETEVARLREKYLKVYRPRG